MLNFGINPLSANEQCHTSDQIFELLEALVNCFSYMLPAIQTSRIHLIYDPRIELRSLKTGYNFTASINNLPKTPLGADIKKLWYVYTKNHASEATWQFCDVEISSSRNGIQPISGKISMDLLQKKTDWLSFGGTPLNIESILSVNDRSRMHRIRNATNLESIKELLPFYERSPKHTNKPYYDKVRNEYVAAMPLKDDEAQRVLLTSLEHNGERWAYCPKAGKFYRFIITHIGQNTYHGFEAEMREVPSEIISELKGSLV